MKEEFNIYIRKKNDNLYVAYTEDNVLYATGDTIKKVVDNVFETKDRFVKNLKKEGDLGKANELDLSLARINMSEELMVEFRKQIKITSFLSGQNLNKLIMILISQINVKLLQVRDVKQNLPIYHHS